jgi:hypothetical protein
MGFCTPRAGLSGHCGACLLNGRILLENSNQWYFNNLVKRPCHKTPYRCPHRLNLSSQSSRSCALPNIKALKDKDLEFANSLRGFSRQEEGTFKRNRDTRRISTVPVRRWGNPPPTALASSHQRTKPQPPRAPCLAQSGCYRRRSLRRLSSGHI